MAGGRTLVIGASGFLGADVTRQLVDQGDEVQVQSRTAVPIYRVRSYHADAKNR